MTTSDSNLMKSLMYMFTMMMTDALEDEASAKDSKVVKIWIVVCHIHLLITYSSVSCSPPSCSLLCGHSEPLWTKMGGTNLMNCSGT